ncbi:MAG: hypothetical protein ACFFG0_15590 [Candidatus Thorarchaeota archaeon]
MFAIVDGKVKKIDQKLVDENKVIFLQTGKSILLFDSEEEALTVATNEAVDNLIEIYKKKLEISLETNVWDNDFVSETFEEIEEANIFIYRLVTEFPNILRPKIIKHAFTNFAFLWRTNHRDIVIYKLGSQHHYEIIEDGKEIETGTIPFLTIPRLINASVSPVS